MMIPQQRIVTNSSLSDRKGVSLNGILMKGHDTLSNQWDVLIRWRSYENALCSDVTKAYYASKTGELESMFVMSVGGMVIPLVTGAHMDSTQLALVIDLLPPFSKLQSEEQLT